MKAPHSKCGIRATVSGVRIPPSPPINRINDLASYISVGSGGIFRGDHSCHLRWSGLRAAQRAMGRRILDLLNDRAMSVSWIESARRADSEPRSACRRRRAGRKAPPAKRLPSAHCSIVARIFSGSTNFLSANSVATPRGLIEMDSFRGRASGGASANRSRVCRYRTPVAGERAPT